MSRLFGTDGIRGVANADLTPEVAFSVGRAGAAVLAREASDGKPIVIGRDTRLSGTMLEAAMIAGITSTGRDVVGLGVVPTPCVAAVTVNIGAAAGVMISASHNPIGDNGIKFFGPDGFKLSDAVEDEIGERLDDPALPRPTHADVGIARMQPALAGAYLDTARDRAAAEGMAVTFDEGDAEHLPCQDASFDDVVSMFGAMFAPRPALVASEAARVLRPGGRLAMANWTPTSFSGRTFKASARHVPPPPGLAPPVLWGDEGTVRIRLDSAFEKIETELIQVDFELSMSVPDAVAFFQRYFGPTHVAFSRLDEAGRAAFTADLEALWSSANVAPEPESHALVHNEYLQVTAIRRAS